MKVWCSVNGNTGSVVIDGSDDVSDLIRAILKSNPSLGKVDEFAVRVYPPRTDVDRLERFQPLLLDALCSSKEVSGATRQTPLLVIAPQPPSDVRVWYSINGHADSVTIKSSSVVSELRDAIMRKHPSLHGREPHLVKIYLPDTDIDEGIQPLRVDLQCDSKEIRDANAVKPLIVIAPEPERVPQQQRQSGDEPPAKRSRVPRLDDEKFVIPIHESRLDKDLFGREETRDMTIKYLQGCKHKDEYSFDAVSKKFKLLGASGVIGIGKTELLAQICTKWTNEALGPAAKAMYVAYNGSGKAGPYCQEIQAMPKNKIDSVGHLLLVSYGVRLEVAIRIPISEAIAYIRRKMKCVDAPLVICIDEILHLDVINPRNHVGDDTMGMTLAQEIMSGCMSLQDASNGDLIFIFTAILDSMYTRLCSYSGRPVIPLPLAMIPLQDVFENIIPEALLARAKAEPAVHQLVLSCAGHPRATVQGLDLATREWNKEWNKSKDQNVEQNAEQNSPPPISTSELINARNRIIFESKFNVHQINSEIIGQWFDISPKSSEVSNKLRTNLLRKGILHSVADGVEFIFPLLLQQWSRDNRANLFGHHLCELFNADLILDSDSEKHMEAVMYHYEATLRLAMKGRTFSLRDFYRSNHVGQNYHNRMVTADVPTATSLVEFVKNFKDIPKILEYLGAGFIVASNAHNEQGIEYLAPYRDKDQKLLVACVQCKFVRNQTSWPAIREKMAAAVSGLDNEKIPHFPVVYTTADQKKIAEHIFQDGVYFVEKDLFAFTSRLGILRLHTQKLGRVLSKDYPFLKELVRDNN